MIPSIIRFFYIPLVRILSTGKYTRVSTNGKEIVYTKYNGTSYGNKESAWYYFSNFFWTYYQFNEYGFIGHIYGCYQDTICCTQMFWYDFLYNISKRKFVGYYKSEEANKESALLRDIPMKWKFFRENKV